MNVSQKCINLIKTFEGFRSHPYLCIAGVPTLGFGSTHYANGAPVGLSDGDISEPAAENILFATLQYDYVPAVNHCVTADINQNQFDALVDFAYNCGSQNLKNSTLLKLVNEGNFAAASLEFKKWCHCNGEVSQGLLNRREAERKLFMGEI